MSSPADTTEALRRLAGILTSRFTARENESRVADAEVGPVGSVVVVVGAGASLESGLRKWTERELKEELIEAVAGKGAAGDWFVNLAWHQLATQIDTRGNPRSADARRKQLLDLATTDQLCWVAYHLEPGRQNLFDFLQRQFEIPPAAMQPQLAYELVAHFIKHQFVDHVISLNFDEVLDDALKDELGEDGYRVILPGIATLAGDPSLPHLFKLHGTISDVDTLRFATAAGVLSDRTEKLLDAVIFGTEEPRTHVWIVSLGYSWTDPDLRRWIADHHAAVAGVILVTLDGTPAERLRNEFPTGSDRVFSIATREIVAEQQQPATVDEVLWAVWSPMKPTRDDVQPGQKLLFGSAARHLVISHLFRSRSGYRSWPAVYSCHSPEARLEAEILLTTGKTDRMVTLSALARDTRIYRHWSRTMNQKKPVLDRVNFLKRNPFADVTEVYFYKGTAKQYARHFARWQSRKLALSGQVVPDLQDIIQVPRLENGKLQRAPFCYAQFLAYYLEKVSRGTPVEVDPGLDARTAMLFCAPRPLNTYKAFRDATTRLLHGPWRTLLVIAESGAWLKTFEPMLREEARQVLLIEASGMAVERWWQPTPAGLPQRVLTIGLPWWVHNRHLTLAIGEGGKLLGGIYFRRRERTPRISPVELWREPDLMELLKIFLSYVARFYETTCGSARAARDYPEEEAFFNLVVSRDGGLTALLGKTGENWAKRLHEVRSR